MAYTRYSIYAVARKNHGLGRYRSHLVTPYTPAHILH